MLDKDSDLRMVHWYNIDRLFAENPYVKRDKPARSTFRAYYATDDEVERAIAADDRLKARDDPTFRTGRPAIAGEYLGAAPVGVWQLWSPEGVLLGYQDFASADSSFIPCQSNP